MRILSSIKRKLIPMRIRLRYEKYLCCKEYRKMMSLPECEYENYLVKRYAEMMDRFDDTRGLRMDFENPVTYTQKQQWLKLYDQDERKTAYSDKYAVRQHIKEVIGDEYLIPLISIDGADHFYNANDIDYDKLPNSFVMKCNHGSHYNIIVKDKRKLSHKEIREQKRQLNHWLKENYAFRVGLELVYKNIKPCIIIEKYMAIDDDLPDYKFMCFFGEPKYVWVDKGRFTNHRRSLFDFNYLNQNFTIGAFDSLGEIQPPNNFCKMVEIAQRLCEDFLFIRVDLYNIEGKIYFGELTFCSGAGFEATRPVSYESILGSNIIIDSTIREKDKRFRS